MECWAYEAALAADLKLLVEGGWRRPGCMGGMLDPCWRCPVPRGMDNAAPKVGVVARWMSSGGGGDEGRGGAISYDDPERVGILRSGINEGGGMLFGGGARGGGGSIIVGGRVLSIGVGFTILVGVGPSS